MPRSDHAQAVIARLAGIPGPALTVLDGFVPKNQSRPYALLYFRAVSPDGERAPDLVGVEDNSIPIDLRIYVHAVGDNAKAAREVSDRVFDQLMGFTPTITGRECWPIRHDDSQPPERDESTGVVVVDAVDVYRLLTVPA